MRPPVFVAIDFETSHHKRDSACSIGLVRVEGRKIKAREHRLIRPHHQPFMFTHVHGLKWRDVANAPEFGAVWEDLLPLLDGADNLVAHNAPFDKSVLLASCQSAGIEPPSIPFACTMKMSRQAWGLKKPALNVVCARLGITLNHHHALSDALACANIYVAASRHLPGTPFYNKDKESP